MHKGAHTRFMGMVAMAVSIAMFQSAPSLAQDEWDAPERIVAVGDVHGDFDQFVTILRQADLIDERDRWSGGNAHLVQMGDILDRGPDSRKAVDLVRALQKQAKRDGGLVHVLIGNHEALNMAGDLRYVHPGEYAAFESRRSRRLQDAYYERFVAAIKQQKPERDWPTFDKAHRQDWNKKFPLGWVEHRQAWAPDGEYGEWARGNNAVIRIGRTLFVHAGLGPRFAERSIRDLNETVRAELALGQAAPQDALIFDDEGPLWYRGFALNTEGEAGEAEEAHIEALLARYGVDRIIIAHTPLAGAVLPLFNARVLIVDVGLAAYYGGRQAYLEIKGETLTAVHRGTPLPIPDNDAGVEAYLEQAAALDPEPSPVAGYLAKRRKAREAAPDPETP